MPRSEYIADLFHVLITCSGNFCSWFGATPSLGRKCLWGVNPVARGLQQWESRHGQSFLEGRLVMVYLCLCLFAEPHTWQEGDAIGNTCLALSPFLTAMCPRLPSADDACPQPSSSLLKLGLKHRSHFIHSGPRSWFCVMGSKKHVGRGWLPLPCLLSVLAQHPGWGCFLARPC